MGEGEQTKQNPSAASLLSALFIFLFFPKFCILCIGTSLLYFEERGTCTVFFPIIVLLILRRNSSVQVPFYYRTESRRHVGTAKLELGFPCILYKFSSFLFHLLLLVTELFCAVSSYCKSFHFSKFLYRTFLPWTRLCIFLVEICVCY